MESFRGHLGKSLEYWSCPPRLKKITKIERKTYSVDSTPQDAGKISGPSKCLCNSRSSRLRSINSFDFIDKFCSSKYHFIIATESSGLIKKKMKKSENRISVGFLNINNFVSQFVKWLIWT